MKNLENENINRKELINKNKYLLIAFFTIIILIIVVNIIAFIYKVPGSVNGKYLSIFNIIATIITFIQYKILDKPFKN